MKISSITLRNFRSFGPEPVTIDLAELTALVGENCSGKSTVLHALQKLFGITGGDRQLQRMDFHVPVGMNPLDQTSQSLSIEATLVFPELEDNENDESNAVAECFRNMVVDDEATPPYCRVLLEASWTQSNLPEGDIDSQIYWITTAEKDFDETQANGLRDDLMGDSPSFRRGSSWLPLPTRSLDRPHEKRGPLPGAAYQGDDGNWRLATLSGRQHLHRVHREERTEPSIK